MKADRLQQLLTLVPLLAAFLDALAAVGTAGGWFNLSPQLRGAIVGVLAAGFPLLVGVWTIVQGWVHTTQIKSNLNYANKASRRIG